MKIALFGKTGQLGWEFEHGLLALGNVFAFGRYDLDIANTSALQVTLKQLKPDLIINTSAYTNVDLAETDRDKAYQINALAPGYMAELARELNSVFIHYSTDYVFDGISTISYKEDDPTHPLNVYGESKLQGEENIKQVGDAYLILRTSWVYSMRRNSFVNKVLGWARKIENLKIVDDQISNPTWAKALAETTCRMISNHTEHLFDKIREKRGLYHLAGSGFVSRFEWAKKIIANTSKQTEYLVNTIEPVSSDEFPTLAKRPLFTALDCLKFEKIFGLQLPNWEESLKVAMTK